MKAESLLRSEFDRVYQRGIQRGLTIAAVMELGDHNGRHVDKVTGRYTEALDLVEAGVGDWAYGAAQVETAEPATPDKDRIDIEAICAEWERLGGECSKDHLGGGVLLRAPRGQVVASVKVSHADFFEAPWVTGHVAATRVTEGFMEELPKLAKAWGLPQGRLVKVKCGEKLVVISFDDQSTQKQIDIIRQAVCQVQS